MAWLVLAAGLVKGRYIHVILIVQELEQQLHSLSLTTALVRKFIRPGIAHGGDR